MMMNSNIKLPRKWQKILATFLLILPLSGCGLNKLAYIGDPPPLSKISNPLDDPNYGKVSMPMPDAKQFHYRDNSLWQPGSSGFFKDLRANEVGDILTVLIDVQDSASFNNETQGRRETDSNTNIGALAGFDTVLQKVLPGKPSLNNLLDTSTDQNHRGTGRISRNERIQMQIAVVVNQRLPNGNIVIYGRQEMRVNSEIRELHVAGIIRPQDIDSNNQITFEKIAEARVAYGGEGQLTNVQQPRYGSQIADILLPF